MDHQDLSFAEMFSARARRLRGPVAGLWRPWMAHGLAVAALGWLVLALIGPVRAQLQSAIIGEGPDPLHNLWYFWHVKEWARGRAPLWETTLFYFPRGISLLTHGVGPYLAFLALPFWHWGPEEAYNGALVVSLFLTGLLTYALASDLRLPPPAAFFAAAVVVTSPLAMKGIYGHPENLSTAWAIWTLLALRRALAADHRRLWAVGVGVGLLGALLTNGYLFVFTALAIVFFAAHRWWTAPASARREALRRIAAIALACLLLAGPMAFLVQRAANQPELDNSITGHVRWPLYHTDLLQLFIPTNVSHWFGPATARFVARFPGIELSSETAVTLPWIGLPLMWLAWRRGPRWSRVWMAFSLLFIVLALGPNLKMFGRSASFGLPWPIPLPYRLFEFVGLGTLRAPGRAMMLGYVGVAVVAAAGLAWLGQRHPRYRWPIFGGALALLFVQTWPLPLLTLPVPTPPAFYQQLASDPDRYGVFDFPLNPTASVNAGWDFDRMTVFYQTFQMTHRKPIAGGYISRRYVPPLPRLNYLFTQQIEPSPEVQVNGQPANPFGLLHHDLAEMGFRYVVLHRTVAPYFDIAGGHARDSRVLELAFGAQPPLLEDDRARVLEVQPDAAHPAASVILMHNWYPASDGVRWSSGPASLYLNLPDAQAVTLEWVPAYLHDPTGPNGLGQQAEMEVTVGDAAPVQVPVAVGQKASLPLQLPAGLTRIIFSLPAGTFKPQDFGLVPQQAGLEPWFDLSFALSQLNLQTGDPAAAR